MRRILARIDFWNLFIGMIIGVVVAMFLFAYLVPNGPEMIKLYHMEKWRQSRSGV